jgi:two-component system alkaline phosphatase synthesis response regulator PhoP
MTKEAEQSQKQPPTPRQEKILVVDDESDIRTLVEFHLRRAGYEVILAENGPTALEHAYKEKPVVTILDRMMPGMDGVEVCKKLRTINPGMYIMMLTALDTEEQKVLGLEAGADDYVTKPFSGKELVARVKAMVRRNQYQIDAANIGAPPATVSGLLIDPERRQVWKNGEELELTKLEFDLLKFLYDHSGLVFSRDQLLEQIWNYDYFGDGRVVDVHLARLRKKLEDDPSNPRYIHTIRGVGYRFSLKP